VIRVRIRGVKYRTKYRNPVNQLTLRALSSSIGQGSWEAIGIITGIYLQVVPDNSMSTKLVFRRVGYAEFTELEEPNTVRQIKEYRVEEISPGFFVVHIFRRGANY
jgi:hypothetical protein